MMFVHCFLFTFAFESLCTFMSFFAAPFYFLVFFFFKQKTAYEMRISDWSSDVCSSDLERLPARGARRPRTAAAAAVHRRAEEGHRSRRLGGGLGARGRPGTGKLRQPDPDRAARHPRQRPAHGLRSEEHTSELQSLMRISYAVFCLKKQK